MATAKFTLEADEARAVQAYLKFIRTQDKARRGAKELGGAGKRAGKEVAGGAQKGQGALGKLGKGFDSAIASYVGLGAVIAGAGRAMMAEMENVAQAAENAGKRIAATRDLMFLGEFAKKHPELHREIGGFAVTAALPGVEGKVEVSKALELLVSKTPAMSDEKRMELFRKGLQFRRTTTSDLSTLTNMMIQIRKADPSATPTAIANLIQQTKTEAGATTEAMAQRLPQILGVGKAAGLDVAQTSALFAVATGGGFGPEKAATGLRMMMGRLQGKELPKEGRKIQKRLGLDKGMGIFEQLEVLSGAFEKGTFKLAESQILFGEEAGPLTLEVIRDFKDLQTSLGKIKRAFETPGLDLVAGRIEEVFAPGTIEFQEERNRRLRAKREQVQFEADARKGLAIEEIKLETYTRGREGGQLHFAAAVDAWLEGVFAHTGLFFTGKLPGAKGGEPLGGMAGDGGGIGERLDANTEAVKENTERLKEKNGNGNGNGLRVRVNANVEQ